MKRIILQGSFLIFGSQKQLQQWLWRAAHRLIHARYFHLHPSLSVDMSSRTPVYCLQGDGHVDVLAVGKNVIGRSTVPVEGVLFVNIESPGATISRMQAFIIVAPNGDAWIADCNSTNGTYLSVRKGTGIRLEENHYYQLSDGCTIVLGDAERRFVRLPDDALQSSSVSVEASKRNADLVVVGAMDSSFNRHATLSNPENQSPRPSGTSSSGRSLPYLKEREDLGGIPSTSAGPSRKRPRSSLDVTTRGAQTVPNAEPTRACLSGMTPKLRNEVAKAVKACGGIVVDSIGEATVLVMPTPATRTPKFIIAVGLGIPIVASTFFKNNGTAKSLASHIVSLKHDGISYSSTTLRNTIFREDRTPLLTGRSYDVSGLPTKARAVAKEIITACGGSIVQGGSVAKLTEESLSALFDAILRGKRP